MADAKNASDVSTLLSDLSTLAASLNTESNSINELIQRFQSTLQQLNLGLEVWLDADPIRIRRQKVDADHGDETLKRLEVRTELGFCRGVTEEWTVCLRDTLYEVRTNDYDGEIDDLVESTYERTLLKASRADRIVALSKFPDLLKALKSQAEDALTAIREAKQFVTLC
jgi:hypothetical protein